MRIANFMINILAFLAISGTLFAAPTSVNKTIFYTDSGQGQPLVLIHAFPTDHALWEPQVVGLKKDFRVITLDLWGFGKSAPVDGNAVTMEQYADEVASVLDKLHLKSAIIGGESMGGYVALTFLGKYPDKVSGLILSDTQSIADSPEAKQKREASARDVIDHGTKSLLDGFMVKALSSDATETVKQNLRNMVDLQPANAIASALRGMALRSDTSDLLTSTTVPVLIITGENDALISPQQSIEMHKLAKNSKLVVIPKAGHLSSLEQSTMWNQAVRDYISSIKTQSV